MYGLNRSLYQMRCKSPSTGQAPRPQNSTHGNCVICKQFSEVLRNGRCYMEECDALLQKMAIERGHGLRTSEGADVWVMYKSTILMEEGARKGCEVEGSELDEHMCKCGRALKAPRFSICALCRRDGNVASLRGGQALKQRRKQQRNTTTVTNKIKGLDKIKL